MGYIWGPFEVHLRYIRDHLGAEMAHFFFDMTWLWKAKPDSLPQFQVSIHLQVVFLYTLQSSEMMDLPCISWFCRGWSLQSNRITLQPTFSLFQNPVAYRSDIFTFFCTFLRHILRTFSKIPKFFASLPFLHLSGSLPPMWCFCIVFPSRLFCQVFGGDCCEPVSASKCGP